MDSVLGKTVKLLTVLYVKVVLCSWGTMPRFSGDTVKMPRTYLKNTCNLLSNGLEKHFKKEERVTYKEVTFAQSKNGHWLITATNMETKVMFQ